MLDLLSETRKLEAKPCQSPMAQSLHLTREDELFEDRERYRRLVEKLNYLIVTRYDIVYSVEQILCYLKGAPGHGILYSNHGHNRLECFTDAD